jgi:arylamine N-acetyltransferase
MDAPADLFVKYMDILNLKTEAPSYNFLCRIVKAHLFRIPFENISKLLQKNKGMAYIPDFPEYLTGIEKFNFGGTCYANNYYLYRLLEHLGFRIRLCGADMKNPDVHLISIVDFGSQEYIADAGYAAPFLLPLPRYLKKNFLILYGNEKYIVKPKDKLGNTKVEQYSGSRLHLWYTVKPQSRKIGEFRKVIEDSYADDALFMNTLRVVRFNENGYCSLRNSSLTELNRGKYSVTDLRKDQLSGLIQQKFGIPERLAEEGLSRIYNIE